GLRLRTDHRGKESTHATPLNGQPRCPTSEYFLTNSSDLKPAAEKGVLPTELRNRISALGKQIEHDLQKRLQKEQDDQIWEMWKAWFDEDDREEHVLVLI
ncbi:hypothetical protein LTR70_007780, partial [Exophiala xenobiotica]